MLPTFLFIAIPVLFVIVGAVAAFSFARDPESSETAATEAGLDIAPKLANQLPAHLFNPLPRPVVRAENPSLEEMLASVEAHLQSECAAARVFSHNPSTETLWVN